MATLDFQPPHSKKGSSSGGEDNTRHSYMSNISAYSGVVADAVPISFHNKTDVNLVTAPEESYHTPLSSPNIEKSVEPDRTKSQSTLEQISRAEAPVLPFLKLHRPGSSESSTNNSNKKYPSPLSKTYRGLVDDIPLSSPPKDITTVSNYESSLDSHDEDEVAELHLGTDDNNNNSNGTSKVNPRDSISQPQIKQISNGLVTSNLIQDQKHPIHSYNGSISQVSNDRLNSLTLYSTDHPISYPSNPVNVINDSSGERLPGSFVFPSTNSAAASTPQTGSTIDKRLSGTFDRAQHRSSVYQNQAKPRPQSGFDYYQNNVPAKNLTMPAASNTPPSYYTTSQGTTGAYNNSFRAGEAFTSPKESQDKIKFFSSAPADAASAAPLSINTKNSYDQSRQHQKDLNLASPTSIGEKRHSHSRNSSIHNSMELRSPVGESGNASSGRFNNNIVFVPNNDPEIPPRLPKRPPPADHLLSPGVSSLELSAGDESSEAEAPKKANMRRKPVPKDVDDIPEEEIEAASAASAAAAAAAAAAATANDAVNNANINISHEQSPSSNIDDLYYDNSQTTANQLHPSVTQQSPQGHGQDLDSVSFTSLDNKTLLNTLRNSDLRIRDDEKNNLKAQVLAGNISTATNSEDAASIMRPNSQLSAASTRNLNYQLRPPSRNSIIQQDLDLTDDEQITSLINEMKLRSASNNPYSGDNNNNNNKSNRKSFGYDPRSFVVTQRDTFPEASPRLDIRSSSFNNIQLPANAHPNHNPIPNDSTPSVREKTSNNTNVQSESAGSTLPSPSSKLNKTTTDSTRSLTGVAASAAATAATAIGNSNSKENNNPEAYYLPKNSLTYHHQRYKSDALEDELAEMSNINVNGNSRKSSKARNRTNRRRSSAGSTATATTTRNSSIQSESPLFVKKRPSSNFNHISGNASVVSGNRSVSGSTTSRPLPTPPTSAGTAVNLNLNANANAIISNLGASRQESTTSTAKTVTEGNTNANFNVSESVNMNAKKASQTPANAGSLSIANDSHHNVTNNGSIQDLTAEVEKELSGRKFSQSTTASEIPEKGQVDDNLQIINKTVNYDNEENKNFVDVGPDNTVDANQEKEGAKEGHHHHRHGHRRHHRSPSKLKRDSRTRSMSSYGKKRNSSSSSSSKKVKPFSHKSIARLLEATEGTMIGQEFSDLQIPDEEKRLLERIVDALSRLTADMIADPKRYDEGIGRLSNALRALEGFH